MLSLHALLRARCARHAPRCSSRLLQKRSALPAGSSDRRFHSLGLNDALVQRLNDLGLSTPTAAQHKSIPSIMRGEDVVVAAETGGGKTLSYLLPLVEKLTRHPLAADEIRLPAVLVLTTSQELVRQLTAVLHQVDPELARLAVSLSSTRQTLGQHGKRACPLVFATPGALLRATKPRDFAFTQLVVVDEADMLLSGGFEKETKQILATIRNQPLLRAELNRVDDGEDCVVKDHMDDDELSTSRTQTVFSAATIPDYGKRSVRHYLDYKFPEAVFAITKDFHRTLPQLTLHSHDLQAFAARGSFEDEQHARCELAHEILTTASASSSGENKKTLVFANSIASADALFDFLTREKGLETCALFHKEVDRSQRQRLLQRLDSDAPEDQELVVICTDIAARGLDTTKVQHVVQFEFASDVVSYLHRMGRTGRAGSAGVVSSIESAENSLVLAKIREAGAETLESGFSRKRSLRKKFKKTRRGRPVRGHNSDDYRGGYSDY